MGCVRLYRLPAAPVWNDVRTFDANIQPLDEIVAFVRPRVRMTAKDWEATEMFSILNDSSDRYGYQRRALQYQNAHLDLIDCRESGESSVPFNESWLNCSSKRSRN